jgi:hypothetical protein
MSGHSCSSTLLPLELKVLGFIQSHTGDFGDIAMEIHAWQKTACPAYGAFCASMPPARTWQEIPALPLTAFRQTDIRCFPADKTVRTFHTSGTTGEGFGRHHFRTLELYRSAALEGWKQVGLPANPILNLMPSPEELPHSSLSCMAGWLTGEFFAGQWERLHTALSRIEKPVLFGTAIAFLDFFAWLGDRSVTLPPGSLAIETGGYKGTRRSLPKEDLYALFGDKLGLPPEAVWNEYGMTELSSQFYTRGLGRPHRGAPWVRSLVIDPETNEEVRDGETGVLRIWDLANIGSCCVLQTRDLAIRRGRDFELLGRDPAALPRGCSRAADELLS